MNVASSGRRYLVIISVLISVFNTSCPMVMDNRYFPWLDHLHTATDHRNGRLAIEGFFVTGGDAFRSEDKALKDEQIVSIQELWGELKLAEVGASLVKVGKENPVPVDWQWLSDLKAKIDSSIEGQGIMIAGYKPITNYFGLGGSTLLMRLNSLTSVVPHEDTVKKLFLTTPGNQALFTQMVSKFYKELNINCTSSQEIAAGDTIVYASLHDVREYEYKMRSIDWGIWLGAIIPTGLIYDPHNLASLPFGGNGLWGWFVAPRCEVELKEDLKVGLHARVTGRVGKVIQSRIPIDKEQPLFAPFVGDVFINSGIYATGSLYAVIQDVRAGLGVQAQYTFTYHEKDTFSTDALEKLFTPNFKEMTNRSTFITEYATFRLFYDIGHDKTWKHHPIVTFSWDIPMNHIGGKGFAKTHRVSLGCAVNF